MASINWGEYIKIYHPMLAQESSRIDIEIKIDLYIKDEAKAGPEYRKLAELLRHENWIGYAEEIEKIALDEDRHQDILKQIKQGLKRD